MILQKAIMNDRIVQAIVKRLCMAQRFTIAFHMRIHCEDAEWLNIMLTTYEEENEYVRSNRKA